MAELFQPREPELVESGDTIAFRRILGDFLPANGWSLLYQVSGYPEGVSAPQFESTPDPTNTIHEIVIADTVTAQWLSGQYTLTGYAVGNGERHEIYAGAITIATNKGTGTSQGPTTTHAQRMITMIEGQLEALAAHSLQDTDIQQTEIRRLKRLDLERQLALNKEIRDGEIAVENARNRRPTGARIIPQANIVNGFPAIGSGWGFPFPKA